MGVNPVLAGAIAAAVTVLMTPLVIRLSRRTGVMDHPGPLKPHAVPVPYLGGLAVFAGVGVALVGSPHPAVLLPLTGALALGLVDDVTSLPVLPRFVAELTVGAAVAWSVGLNGPVPAAAVVLGTVALINAVNFVDGIDALAAGVCAVSFLGFAVVLPAGWAQTGAALAGAAAGFLAFNRPPARIYLGDAGSYLLGAAVAVLAAAHISSAQMASTATASPALLGTGISLRDVVVLVPLIGYPLVEAASTVGRRLVTRRALFAGDRDHVYDQLVQRRLSASATAALLVGAHAVVVAAAVATYPLDTVLPLLAVAALLVGATIVAAVPRAVRPLR